jgi:hypothetical protein
LDSPLAAIAREVELQLERPFVARGEQAELSANDTQRLPAEFDLLAIAGPGVCNDATRVSGARGKALGTGAALIGNVKYWLDRRALERMLCVGRRAIWNNARWSK